MYLHQKFEYICEHITDDDQLEKIEKLYKEINPKIVAFDTETTGLSLIEDKPFLIVFGFDKYVYTFEPTNERVAWFMKLVQPCQRLFAHNAKFDYHMIYNFLGREPTEIEHKIADSMTVARLTNYADSQLSLSLESLGIEYVDPSAKFAGKVIKKLKTDENRVRKNALKALYNAKYKTGFANNWTNFTKSVKYVDTDEITLFFQENFKECNYQDIYISNPDLMLNYAIDDVVILLEYLKKSLPVLVQVDKDLVTFNRECELISAITRMEKVGIKLDIDYLLASRKRIIDYREELYAKLQMLTGEQFSVGQHEVIKKILKNKFNVTLMNADKKALKTVPTDHAAHEVVKIIIDLRTVDKWLTTYIDGKLNDSINGRIHTSIKSSGAVSGRVSCDLQQQPKEALFDDNGNELFHPRKCFIVDDGYSFLFADESQMELRVQAYYTLKVGKGDINMLRAYIPFNCTSGITGESFDPKDKECLARWNTGEWYLNEDLDQEWLPTDLHTTTTMLAFPFLKGKDDPQFAHYRKLGKMCNFLKNYQGGMGAIIEQLDVSEEIAESLDKAYYAAFPEIRTYQKWVTNQLSLYGKVSTLYNRTFYMQNSKWFYKAGNYVIQG